MTHHTSGAADLPDALREVQIIQSWCEARCLPPPSAGDCVSLAVALAAGQAPAAQADGVQEDAARYRYLRDGTLVDGAINEDLYVHIDHQSYPNRWALTGPELDEAVDAARKQGANHD